MSDDDSTSVRWISEGRPVHLTLNRCDACACWCGANHYSDGLADEPGDADCLACLEKAAEFGARAAQRAANLRPDQTPREHAQAAADLASRHRALAERAMDDKHAAIAECGYTAPDWDRWAAAMEEATATIHANLPSFGSESVMPRDLKVRPRVVHAEYVPVLARDIAGMQAAHAEARARWHDAEARLAEFQATMEDQMPRGLPPTPG